MEAAGRKEVLLTKPVWLEYGRLEERAEGLRSMQESGDGTIGNGKQVVLTKPLSLDGDGGDDNYRPPRLIKQILSLFKHLRPGSDLSHFQLPPVFNFPKSQLQCYGELVYCSGSDLLSKCNKAETPIERFQAVVSWSISTVRHLTFGVAPYNPVLGETHHVSIGTLNVLLEQVSHHPPLTALHATDERENVEIIWWHKCIPRFSGTSVETEVQGKRLLKLLARGETYEMNSPKLLIRFLPFTGVDWVGNVRIRCEENELVADLSYESNSFLGLRRNPRVVKGKIYDSSTMKPLYEINGHWDRSVTLKNIKNGEVGVLYNAEETLRGLKTPVVKDLQEVWESESAVVWSELSKSIVSRDWGRAREVKRAIEERQREAARERGPRGETWVPRHFTLNSSKDGEWDCSPVQKVVPPAPIVVPL